MGRLVCIRTRLARHHSPRMLSAMRLTPAQQERLRYLLEDEWADEADEKHSMLTFREHIGAVESPEELHLFAGNFNWDCGWEELVVVLEHPKCDYGTALMVY